MAAAISWPELIVLMAYGDGTEDRLEGSLRARDVQPVDDALREADFDDDGGWFEDHPTLGRVRVHEQRLRVRRRGERLRLETPEGRWTAIFGEHTTWLAGPDDQVPTAYPRATSSFGWAGADLAARTPASRWEGNDFTTLTGPIEPVAFLGRPAWAFELAPPPHKPYPLQMVVDAATGLVLRQANADFGTVDEWTALALGVELPDELFEWAGPSQPPADHTAEHERDLARRRAWLAERGLDHLRLSVGLALMPHEWDDDTGAFHASIELGLHGSLMRRARTAEPWAEADGWNYPATQRWSDDRWDWCLGTTEPLEDDQFAELRRQLSAD